MAMNAYGMYDVPPDIAAEQERIARQQAIADAMLKSSMAPLPTNQGPIHWTQVLAQAVNARQGRHDSDAASASRRALGQQYQAGLAEEVKRISALRQGQTIAPDPQEIEQANDHGYAEPRPVSTGNQKAAIEAALLSQYPQVRQMGALEHKTFENEQTKAADREARLHERILTLDAQAANLAAAAADRKAAADRAIEARKELAELQRSTQKAIADSNNETRRALANQRFSVTVPPPVTVARVNDPANPSRMLEVDARTYKGGTLGAPGVIGVSGRESDAQKREGKRQFNMQGIGATIAEAEALLTNKAKPPTGSGFGKALDSVAGFIGVTPSGAAEAEKLRAVGGALTSKMPRMEGPQSDKDVALYKEMAGMVGEASIPIERRVAALEEVKKLWAKYERLNPDAFAPNGGEWEVVR